MKNNNSKNQGANYKRNHNNKHKGNNKPGNSNTNDTESKEMYKGKGNDYSWYVVDEQILKDAFSVPFSWPTGYPFRNSGDLVLDSWDHSIAGILSQGVMPTFGNAKSSDDAVNNAMFGFYSFVRHMNSGSKNYDPVDLMLYVLAIDAMYYWISWGTRIYSTLCMYSQGNRYLPQDLCEAQSIDFNDFSENMNKFRADLNQRITKVSTFLLPSVMPLLQRHSWLFSNYYIEGDTVKDQVYFYYPEGYYVFGLDSDGAGKLYAKFKGSNLTVQDYMDCLDEMINAVIGNEDFNTMSGDIFKAYQGKVLTLTLLPDMIIADLVRDETVLLQFKNAKPIDVHRQGNLRGDQWYDNFFDVEQSANKDYLKVLTPDAALLGYRSVDGSHSNHFVGAGGGTAIENACLQAKANILTKKQMVVSPHADVTPKELADTTRGTMAFYIVGSAIEPVGFKVRDMYFGSEWYCGYNIYVRARNNVGVISTQRYACEHVLVWDENDANAISNASNAIRRFIPALSQFKYHPEIYLAPVTTDPAAERNVSSMWDVDNYAFLNYETLGRMHSTALMGEFNIPKIAWSANR